MINLERSALLFAVFCAIGLVILFLKESWKEEKEFEKRPFYGTLKRL